jgi:hypothetical protein
LIYFIVFKYFYREDSALLEEIVTLDVIGNKRDDESSRRKLIWKALLNDDDNFEQIRNVIQWQKTSRNGAPV